jgi:Predicted membrane protein
MINILKEQYASHKLLVKYMIIGCSGAILDFIIYVKLQNYLYPVVANVISISIGITNNFIWNAYANFKSTDRIFVRFLSFYATGLLGLGLSSVMIVIFIRLGWSNIEAKLATVFFVAILQYMINKHVTFRKHNAGV